MESQLEMMEEVMKCTGRYKKEQMDVMSAHADFTSEVYRDGALSPKVKRLIALGVALRAGCVECIIPQTRRAVEAGATKDEVLEAVAVAISMSGTTAFGWSWRVVKVLEELGKL